MVGGCHQVSWLYKSADNMIPYFLRKKTRENIHTQKKMKGNRLEVSRHVGIHALGSGGIESIMFFCFLTNFSVTK